MKKIISIASAVIVLCCAIFLFTACADDKTATIKSYSIEEKTYVVGDTFSTDDVVITAELNNGEKRKIDTHLKFDTAEIEKKLDDGKFTEKGEYIVTVYAVEERKDMKIGDWKIIVGE